MNSIPRRQHIVSFFNGTINRSNNRYRLEAPRFYGLSIAFAWFPCTHYHMLIEFQTLLRHCLKFIANSEVL